MVSIYWVELNICRHATLRGKRSSYCESLGGVFAWMYEKDALVVTCETLHNAQQVLQDGFASVQVWIKGMCGHKYHSAAGAIFSEKKQLSPLISTPQLCQSSIRNTREMWKNFIWLRILGMEIKLFSISFSQVQVVGRNDPGATQWWYWQGQCQL